MTDPTASPERQTGARIDLTKLSHELSALGWTTDVRLRFEGDDRAGYLNAETDDGDTSAYVMQVRDDGTGYLKRTAGGGGSRTINFDDPIAQTFAVIGRYIDPAPSGDVLTSEQRAAIGRVLNVYHLVRGMHSTGRGNYGYDALADALHSARRAVTDDDCAVLNDLMRGASLAGTEEGR